MSPVDFIDRLIKCVLCVKNTYVRVPEKIFISVNIVELVNIEFAVRCETEYFSVFLDPVAERTTRMPESFIENFYTVENKFSFRIKMNEYCLL